MRFLTRNWARIAGDSCPFNRWGLLFYLPVRSSEPVHWINPTNEPANQTTNQLTDEAQAILQTFIFPAAVAVNAASCTLPTHAPKSLTRGRAHADRQQTAENLLIEASRHDLWYSGFFPSERNTSCVDLAVLQRLLEGWAFVLAFRSRAPPNVLTRAQTRSAYLSFQLGE